RHEWTGHLAIQAGRKLAIHAQIVVRCKRDLLQVVLACGSRGGFPSLLNRGQQNRDQCGDDRHHDEKFDERKCLSANGSWRWDKTRKDSHRATSKCVQAKSRGLRAPGSLGCQKLVTLFLRANCRTIFTIK